VIRKLLELKAIEVPGGFGLRHGDGQNASFECVPAVPRDCWKLAHTRKTRCRLRRFYRGKLVARIRFYLG
jgi:hypothetical protein